MEQNLIRIEHPDDGLGVFNSSHGLSIFDAIDNNEYIQALDSYSVKRPNLPEDCPTATDDHYCAYRSLEEFKKFYPDGLRAILDRGFKVYSILANNPIVGTEQAAFKKDDIISKIDITNEFL